MNNPEVLLGCQILLNLKTEIFPIKIRFINLPKLDRLLFTGFVDRCKSVQYVTEGVYRDAI